MKKLFILALSVVSIFSLSGAVFSQATFAVKGSIDLMGESEIDIEDVDPGDVDNSFGIGGEVTFPMNEQVVIGGGALYQFPRAIDEEGWDDWDFNYLPIYGLIQVQFQSNNVTPFIGANIGYGVLFADTPIDDLETEGGLYWGIGGGVIFQNGFFIEALYTQNNGVISSEDYDVDADITYTKFSICIGMKF
jgi:hypothetical protein